MHNENCSGIFLSPIITEESMTGIMVKKYTFKVAKDANKIEIAKAIETVFPGTKVLKVNTMNVRGHERRQGYPQWLYSIMEKGYCYSYRRFKGN